MVSGGVIYDIGANNGDDIPYYLMKAERVVAVEANPVLAYQISQRFADAIAAGRLSVVACALTTGPSGVTVPFYVHRQNHVLSQFPEPHPSVRDRYDAITVPSLNVVNLFTAFGEPHYVKIDIEHYDQVILRSMFENGVKPPYISAESHSIEIFALLLGLGGYAAYKMVDGATVPQRYQNVEIHTAAGIQSYSFPAHAAGPFGDDIHGPWMTPENFFRVLAYAGLGWKDIHASRIDVADPAYAPQPLVQISVNY